MPNDNPGCLTNFLNRIGIKPQSKSQPAQEQVQNPFPYRLRDDFLSPAEFSLYKVMKTMMGDHLVICPKVSLGDLFFVTRPHENRGAFNKIDRKHVDFLICDPQTLKPRFGIELDDASHERSDRVERDEFVDGIFFAAGLPLIHLQARRTYNTSELGELFRQALGGKKPQLASAAPATHQPKAPAKLDENAPDTAPICPNCGADMVVRTTTRGPNAGKQFFGCPNYPRCRETLPIV